MGERYTVETAKEVLKRYPDDPYFTAIVEGTLSSYYLAILTSFRDDYLDDLPDVDVRMIIDEDNLERMDRGEPMSSSIRYKCQTNYVLGVVTHLRGLIYQEVIQDPEIRGAIEEFNASDLNFVVGDPDNPERIARINWILGLVISHLEDLTRS